MDVGTLQEDLHCWWARAHERPGPLPKIGQEDHGIEDLT